MTYPDVPAGRARPPPTPRSELDALKARVDALTRTGPPATPQTPVCRVKLASDATGLPANTDTYAQDNWIVGEDPDGLATLSGAIGTNSYLTIRQAGRYLIEVRAVFTAIAAGASCAAFVARNAAAGPSSVVRANRNVVAAGGDGTIVDSCRPFFLPAGDVLYWATWASAGYTLSATVINVPTEVSVTYLGTR